MATDRFNRIFALHWQPGPLRVRIDELPRTQPVERRVRVLTVARRMPATEILSPIASALPPRRRLRLLYHRRSTDNQSERTVSPRPSGTMRPGRLAHVSSRHLVRLTAEPLPR